MKKKGKRILITAVVMCLLIIGGGTVYICDYYHMTDEALQYLQSSAEVIVMETDTGLLFDGAGEDTAIIFYPGAKVEYTAYAPLLYRLASEGIDCFAVKMPGNLAVLGQNKADDIFFKYTYENWYLAGHSLGGAMAAGYAAENEGEPEGLILLASYPTKSMTEAKFAVLSVYGSEDKVLNRDKLMAGRAFMPEDYTEICIEGGNHAGFGSYGEQKGDGAASVAGKEQQEQTVKAILDLIRRNADE